MNETVLRENEFSSAQSEEYRIYLKRVHRKKVGGKIGQIVAYLVIAFTAFLLIFPYWLKLVESLMATSFIREFGKLYWWTPGKLHFENYIEAIKVGDLLVGFGNTVYFAVMSTVIATAFAFVAGYVFGKMEFRGKNVLFMMFLSTMMVPGEVLLIPMFVIVKELGLYNTVEGAFIPGLFNVFGVFLIRQFMSSVPDSVLEAAKLDGAGELRVMLSIVLPMSLPAISTFVIMEFTNKWNEYLWPRMVLQSSSNFLLQLKLIVFNTSMPSLQGDRQAILKSAATIIITMPIIAVYLCFQKYFLRSMNVSGLK